MKKRLDLTTEELIAISDTLVVSLQVSSSEWGYTPAFRKQIQKKVYAFMCQPTYTVKMSKGKKPNED